MSESEEGHARTRHDDHRTLVSVTEAMDLVTTAITRPPTQSSRDRYETMLVLEQTIDRVPPDLLREIAACDLGVGPVIHDDTHLVVEVR